MVLLGDVGQAEARLVLFSDSFYLGARRAHGLMNLPWARQSLWAHLMVLLGDVGQVEACLGRFGDSVNLSAR
jgi:hypothetical protein